MVDEDVPEDEVGNEIVKLHLSVSYNHNHPHSVAKQEVVDAAEEPLEPIVHLGAQQQQA